MTNFWVYITLFLQSIKAGLLLLMGLAIVNGTLELYPYIDRLDLI